SPDTALRPVQGSFRNDCLTSALLKGKGNFIYMDAAKFGAHAANLNLNESWSAFGIQNAHNGSKCLLDDEWNHLSILSPVPGSNDGPVKVVADNNYREIAKDLEKMFYAPWSRVSHTVKFRKAGSFEYIDHSGNRDEEDFVKFITENTVNKFEVKVEEAETRVETEADELPATSRKTLHAVQQPPSQTAKNVNLSVSTFSRPDATAAGSIQSRYHFAANSGQFCLPRTLLEGKVNVIYLDATKFGAHAANSNLESALARFWVSRTSRMMDNNDKKCI
ncbi:protein disulfide-isomerase precursor, partial [Mortierella sp. NVP85]